MKAMGDVKSLVGPLHLLVGGRKIAFLGGVQGLLGQGTGLAGVGDYFH